MDQEVMRDMRPDVAVGMEDSNPHMASFFDRFTAFSLDALIINILSLVFGMFVGFTSLLGGDFSSGFSGLFELYVPVFAILFGFLYVGWFYVHKGQTPGKMIMKIKVVRSEDLRYLSWGQVFRRDVAGKWISGFAFSLGYLWYFMDEKRRTWHDIIAKTYVIKTDDNGQLLMNGPKSYSKEPIKTFLPLGCMAVLMIIAIVGLVFLFSTFVASVGDDWNHDYMQDLEMQQQVLPDDTI